ncbi:MAG: hypothetical protein HYY30_14950 [Chloroflexi bacterium]|nr:hypothetical protein [Chloroflexota bacterium]
MRLVALCFLIDSAIGHRDTESDFRALAEMAGPLGYGQDQLQALIQEVGEAYRQDMGKALIAKLRRRLGQPRRQLNPPNALAFPPELRR